MIILAVILTLLVHFTISSLCFLLLMVSNSPKVENRTDFFSAYFVSTIPVFNILVLVVTLIGQIIGPDSEIV